MHRQQEQQRREKADDEGSLYLQCDITGEKQDEQISSNIFSLKENKIGGIGDPAQATERDGVFQNSGTPEKHRRHK